MKSCLCIDDSPESRVIMGLYLKDIGYKVTFAGAGHKAIEKLRECTFDMIVLDIRMPDLSGNAVASYIRNHPAHRNTKVISMTASSDQKRHAAIIRAGANIVLTKPIEFDYLEATINSLYRSDSAVA